jgi:hypothetical protein
MVRASPAVVAVRRRGSIIRRQLAASRPPLHSNVSNVSEYTSVENASVHESTQRRAEWGVYEDRHHYPAQRLTRGPSDRSVLTALALRLSWISVAWAALSRTASLIFGVLDHSLAIVGLGLNLLADLAGSLVLICRFDQGRRRLHRVRKC